MPARAHDVVALLFTFLCAPAAGGEADAAWAKHALMGQCFPSTQKFVESVAGPQALGDENIKIRQASPLADGSTWVVDQTAQTNHEWYLLQPGNEAKLCLTLFVPAAAQVTLKQGNKEQTADSETQASPGFPVKEVHFVRPQGERTFHPAACTELRHTGGAASRKKVPCAGFYD
ncbi:hypothetical protein WMF38_50630 [Sorangium sp. So ce118]